MKKMIILTVFAAVLALGSPLFAQKISPENTSEYFFESKTLEKVYPTMFGYILIYNKWAGGTGRLYVPNEWFSDAAGKAELITLPPGANWPSVTLFFKGGEFSHLRLYVHRWRGHDSWGNIPLPVNSQVGHYFKDVETLKFEY